MVRDRDRVRRNIRVRAPMDNDFVEQQGHDHRILTLYDGNIEGMETAMAVVLNPSSGYPNAPTGATGSSGGSSMSNSPAEGATANIYSRGRAKQDAPSPPVPRKLRAPEGPSPRPGRTSEVGLLWRGTTARATRSREGRRA